VAGLALFFLVASHSRLIPDAHVQAGIDRVASGSTSRKALLFPPIANFDFGQVPQGATKTITFGLRNPSSSLVEVKQVRTSCECFTLKMNTMAIPPGEAAIAEATVDFSDDPRFAGRLELSAEGLTTSNEKKAFFVHITVEVGQGLTDSKLAD